ncbi:copper amine oxidase N-terminal domain-containing protein [Paenibacillus endoradicis]|uniref:copper amine oxidase N-terminal domain-containing protein n=1 Tax=Paenibacillus endoradicis TaxID=2972487 RepID=UPI0021597C08|nr:copper amine oxidase N-terminal domain-containing protein [Paenibacillus endoradicis]MCR8658487.1 copper amine oxidase N-terminal domain-containing protein [Paenibacillus endoradicis]
MMKKSIVALLAAILLLQPFLPNQTFAQSDNIHVDGKLVRGSTLIPLRVVSEALDVNVKWAQQTRTVTMNKGNIEIVLPTNSNYVTVNGESITLDTRPQIDQGVTFVPIRFISQTIGATVNWEQKTGIATVTLDNRKVIISTKSKIEVPEISEQRINTLIKEANAATNLSAYKQIRTHFKPYFTDTFINKIIQQAGLKSKHQFTVKASSYFYTGEGHGYLDQIEVPKDAGGMYVERRIMLRYIEDKWMIEDIFFTYLNP